MQFSYHPDVREPGDGGHIGGSVAREAQVGYELVAHPNLILMRAYSVTLDGCPHLVMDLEGPTFARAQSPGEGIIHVHHLTPLSHINAQYRVDPIE